MAHVRFVAADAQTHRFEPATAEGIFSRFGVMFFADPNAAFGNLGAALRAGGRLAFVCWQPVTENPWMSVPMMAAAGIVPLKPPPPPDAPGPFSFGDRERVSGILTSAGFHDVAFEPFTPEIVVAGGGDMDETVRFLMQVGPLGAAIEDAGSDAGPRVAAAVREAVTPYASARGVAMPSAAWIVTARR